MSEFGKWQEKETNYHPDHFVYRLMLFAWNAALEAAANDIMENSPLEWPENIAVADAILVLKHTPEQSNG